MAAGVFLLAARVFLHTTKGGTLLMRRPMGSVASSCLQAEYTGFRLLSNVLESNSNQFERNDWIGACGNHRTDSPKLTPFAVAPQLWLWGLDQF